MSRYDNTFFLLSLALLVAGLFILYSASIGISISKFGHPYYFLSHQILYGVIPGIILFYFSLKIPYHFWQKFSLPIMFFSIVLMFLVFIPNVGFYHGGARRWISLGPIFFQPAEILKFAYIVYLASWFDSKSKHLNSFKLGFLPFGIMSAFIASFLVLQPDIGTLGTLIVSAIALFFLSGGRISHIGLLTLIGMIILGILVFFEPYRLNRISVFFDPSYDLQGIGYQMNQAMIAIGSGGIFGRGLGLSQQKFSFLPEPVGDSVFAIFAEEMGFLGSIFILVLFLAFFWRGLEIAKQAPDLFAKLLASGFLFLIIFQAFINIAAISGLLPLTGIPLSFVSYGGSALAIMIMEIGIILNISRRKL
ncbi:putative lipid II flippase FtsW [Candidatus Giovannonibacteria bacterium]|nr:putative lipid II flippase FtsW [Candidatus Giovannonibacteria bacterium]